MPPSPPAPLHAFLAGWGIAMALALPYLVFSLGGFFHADDWVYLFELQGRSLLRPWEFFALEVSFFWRPLADLLLRVQWALFGLEPAGFLAVSLLLHGLVIGAFAVFAGELTSSWRVVLGAAVIAASGWIGADAVSWVSNQATLLSALLGWLMLASWLRAESCGESATGRLRLAAAGLFALALLAKQSAVAFLPAAVVLTLWKAGGERWEARRLRPLLVLLVPLAVYLPIQAATRVVHDAPVTTDYSLASPVQWPLNLAMAFGHALLSPLGGENMLARRLGLEPGGIAASTVLVPVTAAFLAVAWAARVRGVRPAACLYIVLFLPILLFDAFHAARFYYMPFMALSLAAALLLLGAGRRRLYAAGLAGCLLLAGPNWIHLWRMAAFDARLTDVSRVLFEEASARRGELRRPALHILPSSPALQLFGLRELLRLATDDGHAEAVFTDTPFGDDYLRQLHDTIEVVYFLRRGPDGWHFIPRPPGEVLPARSVQSLDPGEPHS